MPAVGVDAPVVVSVRRTRIAFSDGTGFSVAAPSVVAQDGDGRLWLTSKRWGRKFRAWPFRVGSTRRLVERIVQALEAESRYGPPLDVTEGVATFRDVVAGRLIRIDTWGG
jgi:hypothetical protein